MDGNRRIVSVVVVTLLLSAVGIGTYYIGQKQGRSAGTKLGYIKGYEVGLEYGTSQANDLRQENQSLQDQYNKLVDDYNGLREAAVKAVGAAVSRSYNPLTCYSSSSSLGYSLNTTTNCY